MLSWKITLDYIFFMKLLQVISQIHITFLDVVQAFDPGIWGSAMQRGSHRACQPGFNLCIVQHLLVNNLRSSYLSLQAGPTKHRCSAFLV